jgi:ribonucleoside-diphosphate reductase alpha chain
VGIAVRMMDNTIDVSRFPLEAQRQEAFAKRRIGLGMTGLADALIMTGLRYGSPEAAAQAERWAERISHTAYRASCDLAVEKGAFPLFDREAYLAGETVSALPHDIRERITAGGIRNALLTSIAPTGTISLFADNVSSGIEPVFALSYIMPRHGLCRVLGVPIETCSFGHAAFGIIRALPGTRVACRPGDIGPDPTLATPLVPGPVL